MFKLEHIYKLAVTVAISFNLFGCFDKPDEFVAPTWDTQVHFPITAKEFGLSEIIEKDSSLLKSSDDPTKLGLIYIGDSQPLSTITIEDELKIDAFESRFSQNIGAIKVEFTIPTASKIKVEDWAPEVTSGSYQIFPEQEGNITLGINGVATVERIVADSATLVILVENKLPVDIVLRGIKIQNSVDQTVIAEKPGLNPSDWVLVPRNGARILSFTIYDKVITNSLEYVGTIWSEGSNGEAVQIPEEAGTTINAVFRDLIVSEATAALPPQNFQFTDTFLIDDSTKITEAIIDEGSATISIDNNIDANINANILFNNLFNEKDEQFGFDVSLTKKEINKVINIPSLENWTIRSTSYGIPTNEIEYSVHFTTDSTGEISTLNKNDSISFNLNFNEIVFKSFEGQLKPTRIALEESGFRLDYGDIKDQFHYGDIDFKGALFYLNINSSIDLDLILNGEISANNGSNTFQMPIQDIFLPTVEPSKINITELLNQFSYDLPDSFAIMGSAFLNPYYQNSKVIMGDSIFGSVDYEIPLNIGISEGSFKDTLEIDLGDVDEDDINRLNYGEITFTVYNSVPVGLRFNAIVMDSNYTPILNIPNTERNQPEFLEVPNPEVSGNGDILLAGESVQTVTIFGDGIKKLLNNPYLEIQVFFSTAGTGTDPVKFKTSNNISFDVIAKGEYKVEL